MNKAATSEGPSQPSSTVPPHRLLHRWLRTHKSESLDYAIDPGLAELHARTGVSFHADEIPMVLSSIEEIQPGVLPPASQSGGLKTSVLSCLEQKDLRYSYRML